ncbi:MAG: hypothetical protein IVW52_09085 [Acidimicrobiales bacterium]|nr:hypothetical protein [Acidimicrobiales bacterium]
MTVHRLVVNAPKEDLSDIDAVAEDSEYRHVAPWPAVPGPVPLFVKRGGNGIGSEPVLHVAPKDEGNQRGLVVLDPKGTCRFVDHVTKWSLPATPLASGRFALHAGDDSVDDRGALKLGEDTEHLDHHATGR